MSTDSPDPAGPDPAGPGPSEIEPSEIDRAAQWLEKLTKDPMADAVPGRVRVAAASAPEKRGRYQECALELIAEAPGIPPTPVELKVVFPRAVWPRVGDVLPARISRSRPDVLEVDWDVLSRR